MGVFSSVGAAAPFRTKFDLSYDKKFTGKMGVLYPIMCDEVVPGDVVKLGMQGIVRFQPMLAPMLHSVNVYSAYWFVPYRLLDKNWETFISGGSCVSDGTSLVLQGDSVKLPKFSNVNLKYRTPGLTNDGEFAKGGFADIALGIPPHTFFSDSQGAPAPMLYPWCAKNFIYNEYFRDENLEPDLRPYMADEIQTAMAVSGNTLYLDDLDFCNWRKDYFTSSLLWQQKGTAPALPVTGSLPVRIPASATAGGNTFSNMGWTVSGSAGYSDTGSLKPTDGIAVNSSENPHLLYADASAATTFDVADLRFAFQVQKWLERNARGGSRYNEFLRNQYGVAPRDERLQRPEYIGGSKSPVVVSEVLQTSSTEKGSTTTTAQGNMSGHAISADSTYIGTYRVQEFGLILGYAWIMPVPAYMQGVNRQWMHETRYDFFNPLFVNLSEQAVKESEIYCQGTNPLGVPITTGSIKDDTIFGYQQMYAEMRYKPNMVCSSMRDTFDYWHLARKFDAPPSLNKDFIKVDPSDLMRVFAVQDEDSLILDFGNDITMYRPIPYEGTPSLIDHH